jgi:hypothetical protein
LFHFTTRSLQPKSGVPKLIAVNGGDPMQPESFRPMLETSTIELVFSEPLDSRSVVLGAGAVELLDGANAAVPVTLLTDGIHVVLDPKTDLTPNTTYTLKLGAKLLDRSGDALTPVTVTLKPQDSRRGKTPIVQILKTRQANDPGASHSQTGLPMNAIAIEKPLVGKQLTNVLASSLALELGDPQAFDGPIGFTIRRGARLRNSGLDVKLGGIIPVGLQTGDIQIELLTDAGGRMYRNPNQPAEQRPENERSPLYVDLTMDLAIYAVDPKGNAVLAQTILGLQGVGVVTATDGVLDIETVGTLDFGLLGVTAAPANLVLELISDTAATSVASDSTPPTLVASYPGQNDHDVAVDSGIDLVFSEPIDLDRARAGGIALQTGGGVAVPSIIESHGSAVVVRPTTRLARGTTYKVVLTDVADVAGNPAAAISPLNFATGTIVNTGSPLAVTGSHPGVGCALTGATTTSPGRCTSGAGTDDLYHPFTLATDQPAEVAFDQPVVPGSVVLGTTCNTGSVRFEEVDAAGNCTAAVKGAVVVRERSFRFIPDVPWVVGKSYKMTLVSGNNSTCDAGELCGVSDAASFDTLAGMDGNGASGGPNIVTPFTGVAPTGATYMVTDAAPFTDLNGSGTVDSGEATADANRAVMHVTTTTSPISSASFTTPPCEAGTNGDGCLYITGAMPVEMQPVQMGCALPDGTSAASCLPVTISTGVMYGTSVTMSAVVIGFLTIASDTKTTIMRVREPANGPVTGYIIDDNGTPKMIVKLDLYMDAPDLSITLSSHDLHSKPLSLTLEGPMAFLPDGRITIAVANTADVPIDIGVNTPVGTGHVKLVLPTGQMKLQLLSRPLRGVLP